MNAANAHVSAICVASKHAMRAGIPVRLCTYPLERNGVPDCTIVEALCAAFAVPGLFKPAAILEPGGITSLYVGLGDFNPTALLFEEKLLGHLVKFFARKGVFGVFRVGVQALEVMPGLFFVAFAED